MDPLVNASSLQLLQYGVLGIFLMTSLAVNVWQARQGKQKDSTIETLQTLRVDDAKEITTKLKEPLEKVANLSQSIYDAIRYKQGQ